MGAEATDAGLFCTACQQEVNAVDRYDRCLACSEGKPTRKMSAELRAWQRRVNAIPDNEPTTERADRKRLDALCRATPLARDAFGATFANGPGTFTRYSDAGKVRAAVRARDRKTGSSLSTADIRALGYSLEQAEFHGPTRKGGPEHGPVYLPSALWCARKIVGVDEKGRNTFVDAATIYADSGVVYVPVVAPLEPSMAEVQAAIRAEAAERAIVDAKAAELAAAKAAADDAALKRAIKAGVDAIKAAPVTRARKPRAVVVVAPVEPAHHARVKLAAPLFRGRPLVLLVTRKAA